MNGACISAYCGPDLSRREYSCPDDKADLPRIYSHNRYTKDREGNRRKKPGRCLYCKKRLVLTTHSPENLNSEEAYDAD